MPLAARIRAVAASVLLALVSHAAVAHAQDPFRSSHVVVIVLENKNINQTRTLPYTASLITSGAVLENSFGVTHPSQPNYLALWAGTTQGVTDDACPPAGAPYSNENLGHACEAAGLTWRAYEENLPAVGDTTCFSSGNSSTGLYTRKHAPWTNYTNVTHTNERPYGDLATDLAAHALPNLAFVIPNNCDNSHNGGTGCTAADADAWLAANVPPILAELGSDGVLIVTWDEDNGGLGNHILTVFVGPKVQPGVHSNVFVTHYGIVRTICQLLGLRPFANAAFPSPVSDIWTFTTAVPPATTPARVAMSAPAPNPSAQGMQVRYSLPEAGRVHAEIRDLAGRAVAMLYDGDALAGEHTLNWDGRRADGSRAAAGVYWCALRTNNGAAERRVVVVR